MGQDLHITRAVHWKQSVSRPIERDEWLGVVAEDAQLRIDLSNGECFARFAADPQGPASGWLDWSQGRIFAKRPSETLVTKMLEIATRLDAVVQDDQGAALPPQASDEPGARQEPPPAESPDRSSLLGRLSGRWRGLFGGEEPPADS